MEDNDASNMNNDATDENVSGTELIENTDIVSEEGIDNDNENDKDKEPSQVAAGDISEEEELELNDAFFYEKEDFMGQRDVSDHRLATDFMTLQYSFGYECTKRSNMHFLEESVIIFAAGNVVQIVNLTTLSQQYLETIGGCGIGAISVHPNRQYFAVAEKGDMPSIFIYDYPSLRLYRILREGTERAFAHVNFSPTGSKLASVGSYPDYMLTVWDWKSEQIILRSKAFSQEVFKVTFSPENEGQLTTSGTGHIRFWKMARTFTGLKLQGLIGKFGRTELTDISGYVELPDGKVLSGTEWGNMLLWDGGLIKCEISKVGGKTCHVGAINECCMEEGELITAGSDGYVKVWDFETIDNADFTGDRAYFEMEPMWEIKVGNDVNVKCLVKSVNRRSAGTWFVQDAKGAIWRMSLTLDTKAKAPEKLLAFHSGSINGIDSSPVNHVVATAGADGSVRMYDYHQCSVLCHATFNTSATCLTWAPEQFDQTGKTILVGFADGVVRQLVRDGHLLHLCAVFKPHKSPVLDIKFNPSGRTVATSAEDSTIFFLNSGVQYTPLGFLQLDSPANSLDWSIPDQHLNTQSHLLAGCRNGDVIEIDPPVLSSEDLSKKSKFLLENIFMRTYRIRIPQKVVEAVESSEDAASALGDAAKKEEDNENENGNENIKKNDDDKENSGTKNEEAATAKAAASVAAKAVKTIEEKEEPQTSSVLRVAFNHQRPGSFFVSLDGRGVGSVFECLMTEEDPITTLKINDGTGASSLRISNKYLLTGATDGSVQVHPLKDVDRYWAQNVHDNNTGAVTGAVFSFDEAFMITAGRDGNMFVYRCQGGDTLMNRVPVDIKSANVNVVKDIEDSSAYSIEEERQKAEHNKMLKTAEEKKHEDRALIAKYRHAFVELLMKNNSFQEHLTLPRSEFEMNPEATKQIERETEETIEQTRKELEWETEKHRLALQKLRARYIDDVECNRFVVKAFENSHRISTLRSAKVSDRMMALIRMFQESGTGDNSRPGWIRDTAWGGRGVARGHVASNMASGLANATAVTDRSNKIPLSKAELRKLRRAERAKEWEALKARKPDEHFQDPDDMAQIKRAEQMGDYKLKTDPTYVVPENQRVNAYKKRQELVMLRYTEFSIRQDFNKKVSGLWERKSRILNQYKVLVDRISEIDELLGSDIEAGAPPCPSVPVFDDEEWPDRRHQYTVDDLHKYKAWTIAEAKRQTNINRQGSGGFGGFGGFGGNDDEEKEASETGAEATAAESSSRDNEGKEGAIETPMSESKTGTSHPGSAENRTDNLDASESSTNIEPTDSSGTIQSSVHNANVPVVSLSELELMERRMRALQLNSERSNILVEIKATIRSFDVELRRLRQEQFSVEATLKAAELKVVLLYQELVLLKEFEKRDNTLAQRLQTKADERNEMAARVDECTEKVNKKTEFLQDLEKQLEGIHNELLGAMGDNKWADFLFKVFKKKIKRAKKVVTTKEQSPDDADGNNISDSDDDLSDDDFSDMESENDELSDTEETLDDNTCPHGCDKTLFAMVLSLREKRLDIEEMMADERKAVDVLHKEHESLLKKDKILLGALRNSQADIQEFQTEKQQKLNELDIVVTLQLHQIQYLHKNQLPVDLSPCLVFTNDGVSDLRHHIKVLEKEKAGQRKQHKELRLQHVRFAKDKHARDQKIAELEAHSRDIQMLKFGQVIDVEKLENMSVNKNAEELIAKLTAYDAERTKELHTWMSRINESKRELTAVTKINTRKLERLADLSQSKYNLEAALNSNQHAVSAEFSGPKQSELQELDRLKQLVKLQSMEVHNLREEIASLSRKGGHIFPPVRVGHQPHPPSVPAPGVDSV